MPFDIVGARQAGYSDAEIADSLAQDNKFNAAAARKAGYSDQEILGHLLGQTDVGTEAPHWYDPSVNFVKDVARTAADAPLVPIKIGRGLNKAVGGAINWLTEPSEDSTPEQVANAQAIRDNLTPGTSIYDDAEAFWKPKIAAVQESLATPDATDLLSNVNKIAATGAGSAIKLAPQLPFGIAGMAIMAGLENYDDKGDGSKALIQAAQSAVSMKAMGVTHWMAPVKAVAAVSGISGADAFVSNLAETGDVTQAMKAGGIAAAQMAFMDITNRGMMPAGGNSAINRDLYKRMTDNGTPDHIAADLAGRFNPDIQPSDKFYSDLNLPAVSGDQAMNDYAETLGNLDALRAKGYSLADIARMSDDLKRQVWELTGGGSASKPDMSQDQHDMTTGEKIETPADQVQPEAPTSAINVNAAPKPQGNILDELLRGDSPKPTEPVAPAPEVKAEPAPVEQPPVEVAPTDKESLTAAPNSLTPAAVDQEITHLTSVAEAKKAEVLKLQTQVANGEIDPKQAHPLVALAKVRAKAAESALKLLQEKKQADVKGVTDGAAVSDVQAPGNEMDRVDVDVSKVPNEAQGVGSVATEPAVVAPTAVDVAAHEAAASPHNDLPAPTSAQVDAGNYQKGHVKIHGLDISVENPHGSVRSGVDDNGKPWTTEMQAHYGYLRGTVGKDKDHVDVFIKPGTDPAAVSDKVFVVDQVNPGNRSFDEHKVLMGYDTLSEAKAAYLSNYDQSGASRIGDVTESNINDFKQWLKDGDTSQRFADAPVNTKGGDVSGNSKETSSKTGTEADKEARVQDGLLEVPALPVEGSGLQGGQDGVSVPPPDVKQLWEMTLKEFQNEIGRNISSREHNSKKPATWTPWLREIGYRPDEKDMGYALHEEIVAKALADGKPVPKEVVADYAKPADLPSVDTATPPVKKPVAAELTSDEQADVEMEAALERRRLKKAAESVAASVPADVPRKASDSSVKAWTQRVSVKDGLIHVDAKLNVRPHGLYPDTPDHSFTISVSEWKATDKAGNFYKAQSDLIKKHSPLDDMEAVNGRIRDAQHRAIDKAMSPAGTMTVKEQQAAARERLKKPRTAGEAAKDSAGHAKSAFDAGIDAMEEIFKNANNAGFGSGPVVDDKIYAQLKPHLDKMWAEAKAAFHDAMEALDTFVDNVIDKMGDKVIPYMKKYYREIKSGDTIKEAKATKEAANADEATRPAVQSDGDGNSELSNKGDVSVHTPGKDEQKGGADAVSNSGRSESIEPGQQSERQLDVTSDYVHTDLEKLGHGSPKVKAANNIKAIKIVKDMVETGRLATPEERDTLANYVGWGAASQLFDADRKEWLKEHAELKDLLTSDEWNEARGSTQNAYYTAPVIINSVYDALDRFGVKGGTFKDSATGVGNWIGVKT